MAGVGKAIELGLKGLKKARRAEVGVSQFGLPRTGRRAAVRAAEEESYDPSAIRDTSPDPVPEPEPDIAPSIIRPTRDDLARVVRPPQEKTGIFDYNYKMPTKDSGVQRYQPPRGVPQRTVDLLARPDVFDKMVSGVERGLDVKDWYEMGPAYKSFIDEFGPDEGNRRFDAFMDAIASTSPRSDVGTNVRNATYYYGQANPPPGTNYQPQFSDLPAKAEYPYGHLAQNLHRMNAEKTLYPGGGGFNPKSNPKPLSFAWNFKGDPNLVTVDTHAFRAPAMMGEDPRFLETSFLNEKGAKPRNIFKEYEAGQVSMGDATKRGAYWQSKPRETEYAAWEDYYRRIAREIGITPAEAQAAGWVGNGGMTGLESAPKSAMDFIEERILLTAKKRGMDPADVWREAIRGVRPLSKNEDAITGDLPGMTAVG